MIIWTRLNAKKDYWAAIARQALGIVARVYEAIAIVHMTSR
jgi:hypothetical protein